MPLPILMAQTSGRDPIELLRFYARARVHYCRNLGEENELAAGVSFTNRDFPNMPEGNCLIDAVVPDGISAADAFSGVEEHFASHRTRCLEVNIKSPGLEPILIAKGYQRQQVRVAYVPTVRSLPDVGPLKDLSGVKVIPARASYRHVSDQYQGKIALLDDGHWDALLALHNGQAVAGVGVLAVGDIGLIADLFVVETLRRRGLGRLMVARAMEICARSVFKHVFMRVGADNGAALNLCRAFGMAIIGEQIHYADAARFAGNKSP